MALLTVKDLSLGYDNRAIAEDLNFTVSAGDYLCIVGENGSGKSTLMKTLLHLQAPLKGEIITGDGLKNNEIGYLPQQTIVQRDFPASVKEVVFSGCQGLIGRRPFYTANEKKIAYDNIVRMGMEEYMNKSYRSLSGGQQQRVLLARALCATQKLLVLDEPVAGLDPGAMIELYELINKLNKEGVAIIMISHDINTAVRYSNKILHLGHKQLFYGPTEE